MILSIELAGPKAAVVRARSQIMGRHYFDLLSLVLKPEGWRIIAKLFHYDPIAAKG